MHFIQRQIVTRIKGSRSPINLTTERSVTDTNKKLSYRRETARQLPTWSGGRPSNLPSLRPSGYCLCIWSNPKPATSVRV